MFFNLVRHDVHGEGAERGGEPVEQRAEGAGAAGERARAAVRAHRRSGARAHRQERLQRRLPELGRPEHEAEAGDRQRQVREREAD